MYEFEHEVALWLEPFATRASNACGDHQIWDAPAPTDTGQVAGGSPREGCGDTRCATSATDRPLRQPKSRASGSRTDLLEIGRTRLLCRRPMIRLLGDLIEKGVERLQSRDANAPLAGGSADLDLCADRQPEECGAQG